MMRRQDGKVNFNIEWDPYVAGFGELGTDGEFWIGLETIYTLTNSASYGKLFLELIK